MDNISRIYDYFENKYGLGYLGLFKSASVASMFIKNPDIIPLSVLCIGPSGQFKSRTTIELNQVFVNKCVIDLGSDFTIHSLIDKFDSGKKCDNKTLSINDLTLLFSSKSQRTKDRLVNALAETLSEGKYLYGERNKPDLKFEARINIVANITKNSYVQNKQAFLDNTFIERLVPFFYNLSDEKQISFVREITSRKAMEFGSKIRLKSLFIENYMDFNEELIELAMNYKSLTLSPSLPRSIDKVKAIMGGFCILNQQSRITPEILSKFKELLPFFAENECNDAEIIRLYNQGVEMKEICRRLNYSSTYPYKVVQKYKNKGGISLNSSGFE